MFICDCQTISVRLIHGVAMVLWVARVFNAIAMGVWVVARGLLWACGWLSGCVYAVVIELWVTGYVFTVCNC